MALTVLAMVGCASPTARAPVEDRRPTLSAKATPLPPANTFSAGSSSPAAVDAASVPAKVPAGQENAGKPGYYTVRPGDTLIRIALDNGQNWRDVVRWNGLDNPNLIEVGQVLRVVAPSADPALATARPLSPVGKVESRPLDAKQAAGAQMTTGAASAAVPVPVPQPGKEPAKEADEALDWAWPAAGPIATGFDDNKSKGLAITGKVGDPVLAAADGRVVYSGAGLRGYGNLVIVKHNATYLTAYAHNQSLLVKEDQAVRKGQKIAEMGSSDADRVQLHFEIRRQGRPIDPAKLLPAR